MASRICSRVRAFSSWWITRFRSARPRPFLCSLTYLTASSRVAILRRVSGAERMPRLGSPRAWSSGLITKSARVAMAWSARKPGHSAPQFGPSHLGVQYKVLRRFVVSEDVLHHIRALTVQQPHGVNGLEEGGFHRSGGFVRPGNQLGGEGRSA